MVSINYNPAGALANRQLDNIDRMYNISLQKLSAGKRVVNARDDAASLAVGLRLQLGARALGALAQNVSQGLSVTSIAEGGMTQVQAILGRMEELASQSSSGNLGASERGYLQAEFSQLKTEIDRIAQSTKFGGQQLMNNYWKDFQGKQFVVGAPFGAGFPIHMIPASGIVDLAFGNFRNNPSAADRFCYSSNPVSSGPGTWVLRLAGFGTLSGSIDPSVLDGTTRLASGTSVKLSLPPGTAYTGPAPYAIINLNTNFQLNANSNGNNYAINYNLTSTNNQTLMAFKVGDGGQAYNNITAYFASINKDALGLTNADISTKSSADGAAAAIVSALDVITSARTYMGAIQNRLQVAGENQRVALENINTAVSSYLDVDVAAEMTKMTSTQMLRTIGVSMTSQANQSGQTLVKLLE